jgi:hypothetical protein
MMRWKILELAGKGLNLNEILAALENHAELGLDPEAALEILRLYKDTLSEALQKELEQL